MVVFSCPDGAGGCSWQCPTEGAEQATKYLLIVLVFQGAKVADIALMANTGSLREETIFYLMGFLKY
jgi:hypothetical protein